MSAREKLTSTSVVIPTYCRPDVLRKCVASLLAGAQQPDEIIIAGRKSDAGTENAVAAIEAAPHAGVRIRTAWVTQPGHIPPVEAGVRAASGNLVAVVDDDVTVTPEWLSSMVRHFSDPAIGVVGGRVQVPGAPVPKLKGKPGCISWYGKIWGNGGSVGGATVLDVDTVMECNWMWRRELLTSLEYDPVLNFDDASMYGLDLSLQAKKRRYKVIYDPGALVHHHVAPRVPELDRKERGPRLFSYCRNYTYILLRRLPLWRRAVFLAWWFLIGERGGWGLVSLMVDKLSGDWRKQRHAAAVWRGKMEGIRLAVSARSR